MKRIVPEWDREMRDSYGGWTVSGVRFWGGFMELELFSSKDVRQGGFIMRPRAVLIVHGTLVQIHALFNFRRHEERSALGDKYESVHD